jgi:PST family polysaccharide transporter
MALKSALIWSVSQTAVKMLTGFVSIKVTAVFLGPAGLALVGQLGNLVALVHGLASNAIQTGVTKLTAEHAADRATLSALWTTAMRLSLVTSLLLACLISSVAMPLSGWLFHEQRFWPAVVLGAASLPALAAGGVLLSIVNGLQKIGLLGLINIGAALAGAAIFIPLSYFFGIWGGLIGSGLAYFSTLTVALTCLGWQRGSTRQAAVRLADFSGRWDGDIAIGFARLCPMLLMHAVAELLTPLLVRNTLAMGIGMDSAGIWQACIRLSDTYTVLLTTALSMYLLPHLSRTAEDELDHEVRAVVLKVTAMTAAAAFLLWLLRDFVIATLFTARFTAVREILPLQLTGDVFKLACWPMRMVLVVRLQSARYIAIDVLIAVLQIALTRALLNARGIAAATCAYAMSYGAAFLVLTYLQRRNKHARF